MKVPEQKGVPNKYAKPISTNKNIIFIGTEFQIFKIILLISILALATLFLPFTKSAILAIVFAFAITGARDKINHLSRNQHFIFFGTAGVSFLTFIAVLVSMLKTILITVSSASDATAIIKLKLKILELFLPSVEILKKYLSKILYQLDKTRTIESRLSESVNQALDAFFSYVVEWVAEIPNNILQFFFFMFLLIVLIRKIKSIEVYDELILKDKNSKTLGFLISTAKMSGYNAIVTTALAALAQASLMTLGSIIVGIVSWPIVFIAAFISAMIPIVGILPVATACAIYAGSELNIQKFIVIVFFGLGASLIDNIIRPLLMASESSTLNPILCFFALIGSIYIFGFAGLFIGPFVLLFTATVFKRYQVKKMTGIKIQEKSHRV